MSDLYSIVGSICVDYSCSAVGYVCAMGQPHLFRAYDSMVKYNLQCIYMMIVVTSDFRCGIYSGIVLLYMHQLNQKFINHIGD